MGWFEQRAGLEGTVAIVTGGAGGLGRAIVTDLAANGVRVAVVDIDPEAADALRSELDTDGLDSIVTVGDARDPEVLEALFAAADERWGRLDTLVNVVGGTFMAPFADTSPRAWDALLRTNLTHVLHACSLAIPRMRAGGRGGSIVSVTTIEAHRAAPGFAVYSAAKGAVEQFSRTLAVELAPDRIRVNTVAPDIAPTPNMEALGGDAMAAAEASASAPPWPCRWAASAIRSTSPARVVFLASGLSSYITGTTLHPDGGTFASSGWFNWPGSGWANYAPLPVVERLAADSEEPSP